jgi:hypothetical protein
MISSSIGRLNCYTQSYPFLLLLELVLASNNRENHSTCRCVVSRSTRGHMADNLPA